MLICVESSLKSSNKRNYPPTLTPPSPGLVLLGSSHRASALVGKSVQSSSSSSSSSVSRHAAKKDSWGGGGAGQAGLLVMHPTEGATYSAYCD